MSAQFKFPNFITKKEFNELFGFFDGEECKTQSPRSLKQVCTDSLKQSDLHACLHSCCPFPSRFLKLERNEEKKDVNIETLGMVSANSPEKSDVQVKKEKKLKIEKVVVVLSDDLLEKCDDPGMFS